MPFGNKSTTEDRIWSFKAKPPESAETSAYLGARMHDAHEFRKALVALENQRRERVAAVLAVFDPSIPVLDQAYEKARAEKWALEEALKARNQQARTRTATKADRERKRALQAEVNRLKADLKAVKAVAYADEGVKVQLAAIDAQHEERRKEAGHASPLRWDVLDFIKHSRNKDRSGPPPRYPRWDEEQMLAFRFKDPLLWSAALAGSDERLKITILPPGPNADPHSARSQHKHRAIVDFRTDPETRVRLTVHLYRQPPLDTRIKYLYLHRHLVGRRHTWEVQFVLGRDSWPRDDQAAEGACGVDLGWRVVPDGLRVAYAVGDDGAEHVLTLPHDLLSAWAKVEDLQSIRDLNFDAVRERLVGWIASHRRLLPRWHLEELGYARKRDNRSRTQLSTWKSPEALSWVVRHWRDHRFEGDEAIFETLEAWRKQNRHLYDWQTGQRRQVNRRRDDLYRKFARRLARSYQLARLRAVNYRELKGRPEPDESDSKRQARLHAQHAAPGRLAQFIREAMTAHARIPADHPLGTCHACEHRDDFDAAAERVHTCSACGATWDQDQNAALNLLGWSEVRELVY